MKVFEKRFVEANVVAKEGPSGPADRTGKVEFANSMTAAVALCKYVLLSSFQGDPGFLRDGPV